MQHRLVPASFLLFVLALFPPVALGSDAPEKAPGPDSKGKLYAWQAADGLRYEYYVPEHYDAATGANLTFVLHGSNLDRRWGFANHEAGRFRRDDVVVCPDGTTSNGQDGFNSLQGDADLKRLKALHDELRGIFTVRATFLYGHSQGSFFAFYYAGAYPEDVQGLVGQASGVWIGTQASKRHHHQAIVLMHGTADPVVPYGQSAGGLSFYRDAGYPLVRLRSLEGWNHWPYQDQTEQELAWCEALTSTDPARLVACFETIDALKAVVDPVAAYQVAERLAACEGASAADRARAKELAEEIQELALEHARDIGASLGKAKGDEVSAAPWLGHLRLYLRDFAGVPACDELAAKWSARVENHEQQGSKLWAEWWRIKASKPADAFDVGIDLVSKCFLRNDVADEELMKQLEEWRKDRELGLRKAVQKAYDETVPAFRETLEKGAEQYWKRNGRYGSPTDR